MKICIVNTERNHVKRYQIMARTGTLFEHLYPGKLFTLNEAIKLCTQSNYTISAIGTMWHCLNK